MKKGPFSPPRQGVAHLGEPLRLGELATIEAYVCDLFGVDLVARFVIVMTCFGGHCVTCLSVSLLD